MKSLFRTLLLISVSLFSLSILFVSCENSVGPEQNTATIPKEYWGTWIQMDTGTEYYIDNYKVYESSSSSKKYREIASSISGYTLESENVIKNGNKVFFRKGGNTRDFSVQIAGFADSYSRSVGTGRQEITGRRRNQENSGDSQNGVSGANGTLTFTDAVAGDTQNVTVMNTTAAVTPKYNGENLGTIPVVESGMYGFKTTYTINSDSEGFCYGNYYKT